MVRWQFTALVSTGLLFFQRTSFVRSAVLQYSKEAILQFFQAVFSCLAKTFDFFIYYFFMAKTRKIVKKKVQTGVVHIKATFNNTLVTVTDSNGNVISWSSAGACGFKGARKSTPFAAQEAATAAIRQSIEQGLRKVEVQVSGPGSGRETALRAIQAAGVGIRLIRDITPIPHNGCRAPKKRRV